MHKGFTLVEILITISIIAVVSIVGFLSLFEYRDRQDLDLVVQEIVIILRNAQDRSISQESSSRYGVHFENPAADGSGFYDLFSGVTYATGTIVSKATLRPTIQFSEPASGNSKDVIFSPVSGLPNASTTITISLRKDPAVLKTIIINANGQIQY
jgi:prepilin-type N-terminal cleavage/methylation domain-containing protein